MYTFIFKDVRASYCIGPRLVIYQVGQPSMLYADKVQLRKFQFKRPRQLFAPHVQGMGASPGVVSNCGNAMNMCHSLWQRKHDEVARA